MRTWIVPADPAALVAAVLAYLADDATIFIEGELAASDFPQLARRTRVVIPLVTREAPAATHLVILALTTQTAPAITDVLVRDGKLADVAALQIVQHGTVKFIAGDSFHPECISVDSASSGLLTTLLNSGLAKILRPAAN